MCGLTAGIVPEHCLARHSDILDSCCQWSHCGHTFDKFFLCNLCLFTPNFQCTVQMLAINYYIAFKPFSPLLYHLEVRASPCSLTLRCCVMTAELDLVPVLICHAWRENPVLLLCSGWMKGVGANKYTLILDTDSKVCLKKKACEH